MEAKRKMEELERKRQEDEDLRAAVALQVIFFSPNLKQCMKIQLFDRSFFLRFFFKNKF